MKDHIGVDAHSGIMHRVVATSANVSDATQAYALLQDEKRVVFGDAGYQGVAKRAGFKAATFSEEVKYLKAKPLKIMCCSGG